MQVCGWLMFFVGALVLFWAVFVGVDTGIGQITNLPALSFGSTFMISGAVLASVGAILDHLKMSHDEMRGQSATTKINSSSPYGKWLAEQSKDTPSQIAAPTTYTLPRTGMGSLIKTYKDYKIIKAENGVEVEGHTFPNVIAAEKWINENPKVV